MSTTSPNQPGATPQNAPGCVYIVLILSLILAFVILIPGYIIDDNPVLYQIFAIISTVLINLIGSFIDYIRKNGSLLINNSLSIVQSFRDWFRKEISRSPFAYSIVVSLIVLLLLGQIAPRIPAETWATSCIQVPLLDNLCGNGVGVTQITVNSDGLVSENGSVLNIGIIDEQTNSSFDQFGMTNRAEKELESLIFKQNQIAKAGPHFTLVLVTTLSRTVTDQGLSASVGLEELRGAYLAQQHYNSRYTIKLRLVIANMGVKSAAKTTAPLVAAKLVLYARKSSPDNNFLGVVGFPFSVTSQAALPRLQQNNILVISSSSSSDQLSKEANFYRIVLPDGQQSKDILNFIQNILRPTHVIVLYDGDDPYSQSLGYNTIQELSETSTIVGTQFYKVGQPDSLDVSVQMLLEEDPDLLFFAGYSDDLNALKEKIKAKQQGNNLLQKMRIMGGEALYELGGYTPDNYSSIYFTTFTFPDATPSGKEPIEFTQQYAKAFDPGGEHPDEYGYARPGPHAALAFDAVYAYVVAVQNTSNKDTRVPTPEMIKSAVTSLSFEGVTGSTTFNGRDPFKPSDPTDKPLYIVCVDSNGHTHELIRYGPNEPPRTPELTICK